MKILFVCEGNVNRSQMAAAMLKSIAPHIEVVSAGTLVTPDREGKLVSEISTNAINAMSDIGLDMSGNTIHHLTPAMVDAADRVILVGPTPGGPLPEYLNNSTKLEKWDVPDPGYNQITHTEARDMILPKVKKLAQVLAL